MRVRGRRSSQINSFRSWRVPVWRQQSLKAGKPRKLQFGFAWLLSWMTGRERPGAGGSDSNIKLGQGDRVALQENGSQAGAGIWRDP
jgi:hypothetical protein